MDNISYFISLFPRYLSDVMNSLDIEVRNKINEIRLRRNKPLIIYVGSKAYFPEYSGRLAERLNRQCVSVNSDDFDSICDKLCCHSYHTNMTTLTQGYVTAKNGSRVGVSSSAVYKDGIIHSVRDISSLNIRISHEYKGCSKKIIDLVYQDTLPSIIVAGKPGCGKTTFLRDYAKQLSDGYKGTYKKVTIADERKELAADFDIGLNTDVLCGFEKAKAIEIASRTLAPDLIVCDEIGSITEVKAISGGFINGVSFAVSIHFSDFFRLENNPVLFELLKTNQFDYLIILKSYTDEFDVVNLREVKNESNRSGDDSAFFILPWIDGG